MKDLLCEIDNLLMRLEGVLHDRNGEEVTAIRHEIQKVLQPPDTKISLSLAYEAIENVKKAYPYKMFPKNGKSLDCKSAEMARITCDNIRRELDELISENDS